MLFDCKKRCLETIYVPIHLPSQTNKYFEPFGNNNKNLFSFIKNTKGSYVLIQYPFVNLKALRIISSRFKNFNTIGYNDLPS